MGAHASTRGECRGVGVLGKLLRNIACNKHTLVPYQGARSFTAAIALSLFVRRAELLMMMSVSQKCFWTVVVYCIDVEDGTEVVSGILLSFRLGTESLQRRWRQM